MNPLTMLYFEILFIMTSNSSYKNHYILNYLIQIRMQTQKNNISKPN